MVLDVRKLVTVLQIIPENCFVLALKCFCFLKPQIFHSLCMYEPLFLNRWKAQAYLVCLNILASSIYRQIKACGLKNLVQFCMGREHKQAQILGKHIIKNWKIQVYMNWTCSDVEFKLKCSFISIKPKISLKKFFWWLSKGKRHIIILSG